MDKSITNENYILIKRQIDPGAANNFTMDGFIAEVRNEFYTFTKMNPIILIAIGGFIIGLLIFYIFARCRYPKGKSTIIFTFTLMIVDLCFDIAFIINNVRDVPRLFFPSILTLLVPAGFNFLFAFGIMIQQSCIKENDGFNKWLHNHSAIVGTFTILSMLHIEVLRVLTSRFLELKIFNAPISRTGQKWLFGAGLFNVIIEDIPQFVILILYFKAVGTNFTLIPILTLIISFICLLSSILSRLYEFISFPSSQSNQFRNSFS